METDQPFFKFFSENFEIFGGRREIKRKSRFVRLSVFCDETIHIVSAVCVMF